MSRVGNWIGQATTTIGKGDISLDGTLEGYSRFSSIGDGVVYYSISDGSSRESGIGNLSGDILSRVNVQATLVSGLLDPNPSEPISLSGSALVFCTFTKAAYDNFAQTSGIGEAPIDGGHYARMNASWLPVPVSSVNGKTGAVTITSADIGLGDVDNTSDVNKPVSTATQAALNNKVSSVQEGEGISVDDTDPQNPIVSLENSSLSGLYTSITSGGVLTVNADPTLFDVSAGTGRIVDFADPLNPVITDVSWPALIGESLPDIVGDSYTAAYINSTGTLVTAGQTILSNSDYRSFIVLGAIVHSASVINSIASNPVPAYNTTLGICDYIRKVGGVVTGSAIQLTNADLTFAQTSGLFTLPFVNYAADLLNPTEISNVSSDPVSFNYSRTDGVGGYVPAAPGTNIDPDQWDDGTGTLASVFVNNWTFQPCYFFGQINFTTVVYGQQEYSSKEEAIDATATDFATMDISPGITQNGTLLGFFVVQEGATDLSDPSEAVFLTVTQAFTGGGASPVTDFDQLDDTPPSKSGFGGYDVVVNAGGTALEYANNRLLDAPIDATSYVRNNGAWVAESVSSVNGETGTVIIDSDDIDDSGVNKFTTSSDITKLSGIEAGAEVNDVVEAPIDGSSYVRNNGSWVLESTGGASPSIFFGDTWLLSQILPMGVFATVLFNNVTILDANYSYSSGVVTIATAGRYRVKSDMTVDNPGQFALYVNGSYHGGTRFYVEQFQFQSATLNVVVNGLFANDTLEIRGQGNNNSINIGGSGCRFEIEKLS